MSALAIMHPPRTQLLLERHQSVGNIDGDGLTICKLPINILLGSLQMSIRQAQTNSHHHDTVGGCAKRLYFASRAVMDTLLRPYGLGSTQWYVLYQLATAGPTMQRDLVAMLNIERATLSGVVTTLLSKGLIGQTPDGEDQRQRILRLTRAGNKLWQALPNPVEMILEVAFKGADPAEMEIARKVLQNATKRLIEHNWEGE
jgi:DNA-binding MarR family transcriptional regulator